MTSPAIRRTLLAVSIVLLATVSRVATADDGRAETGNLLVIGGGIRPENAALYRTFIELAGGTEKARVAVLPTASLSPELARLFVEVLVTYGVPRENVKILDVTPLNAADRVRDPAVVAELRLATGIFFAGGDQRRIVEAFLERDGADTPAMGAVREVYRRGGVVAGSSAGAAALAESIFSATGDPIDTLDYGIATAPHQRGVLVQRGLGLFKAGLIDQHFNTFDGRLGRLARVLAEKRVPYGFGIDENTGIVVRPSGLIEVVGAGALTVIDATRAKLRDGPLGLSLSGLSLDYLEAGDVYDTKTRACRISPAKSPIALGAERNLGNRRITDLGQTDAVKRAIILGLIDSASDTQIGLLIRADHGYGHGYQFTFNETDETRGYRGRTGELASYAAERIRLEVSPVVLSLQAASASFPHDLARAAAKAEVQTIAVRGALPVDRDGNFNPERTVTREEFARAVAHVAGLQERPGARPVVTDLGRGAREANAVLIVVAAGVMELDRGRFHPEDAITREGVADALARAVTLAVPPGRGKTLEEARALFLTAMGGRDGSAAPATREKVAVALSRFLGPGW